MNRVLLLGGDIAAFAAALDLAEVGIQVWIADAVPRMPVTEARESGGVLAGFLRELAAPLTPDAPANPGAAPTNGERTATALRSRGGAWQPLPESSVWGIPTFPLAKGCIDLVGMRAAFVAYLDRVKPVLTIGKESNFGKLVDVRLGLAVRETMVEPLIAERFGVPAHETEVALVEPGLNEALTRAGSLSGGAFQQLEEHVARDRVIEPAVGWAAFGELLVERLELYGAVRFSPGVRALEAVEAAETAGGEPGAESRGWLVTDAEGVRHHFDAVLGDHAEITSAVSAAHVAGAAEPGAEERAALSEELARLTPVRTREYVETGIQGLPALGLDGSAADALVLVEAPGGGVWAARAAADGPEGATLRLSGPVIDAGGSAALPLADPPPIAEAAKRLGVSLTGSDPTVHIAAAAFATAAQREEREAARELLASHYPNLLVLGGSLHGGDIDAALTDARERAVRLRRKLTGISE